MDKISPLEKPKKYRVYYVKDRTLTASDPTAKKKKKLTNNPGVHGENSH